MKQILEKNDLPRYRGITQNPDFAREYPVASWLRIVTWSGCQVVEGIHLRETNNQTRENE